jgi:hypothetical protein
MNKRFQKYLYNNQKNICMTAQQLHDLQFRGGVKIKPGSRQLLESMLEEKSKKAKELSQSQPQSEIEWAMKRFPGLTREEAEAIAATQGF